MKNKIIYLFIFFSLTLLAQGSEIYSQEVTFVNKTGIPIYIRIWDKASGTEMQFGSYTPLLLDKNESLTVQAVPGQYFGKITFGKYADKKGVEIELATGKEPFRLSSLGRTVNISMLEKKIEPGKPKPDAHGILNYIVTIN